MYHNEQISYIIFHLNIVNVVNYFKSRIYYTAFNRNTSTANVIIYHTCQYAVAFGENLSLKSSGYSKKCSNGRKVIKASYIMYFGWKGGQIFPSLLTIDHYPQCTDRICLCFECHSEWL